MLSKNNNHPFDSLLGEMSFRHSMRQPRLSHVIAISEDKNTRVMNTYLWRFDVNEANDERFPFIGIRLEALTRLPRPLASGDDHSLASFGVDLVLSWTNFFLSLSLHRPRLCVVVRPLNLNWSKYLSFWRSRFYFPSSPSFMFMNRVCMMGL